MTIEHCPACHAMTAPQGTVTRSDGKQETLYRCNGHSCGTVFSRVPQSLLQPTRPTRTYNKQGAPKATTPAILTDC